MWPDCRKPFHWLKNTSGKFNPGNTKILAVPSTYNFFCFSRKSCVFMIKPRVTGLISGFALILLTALLMFSCTPQSCQEETEVLIGASFYRSGTGRIAAPDSVTVYGAGKEGSYIYKKAAGQQVIFLPPDASSDYCSFVIGINGIYDTLTFSYSTYPHLLSKECGYTFYYTTAGCTFTTNIIDTVIIRNNRVTNRNEENIRIFF